MTHRGPCHSVILWVPAPRSHPAPEHAAGSCCSKRCWGRAEVVLDPVQREHYALGVVLMMAAQDAY